MSLLSPVLAFGFSTGDIILIMFICLLLFGSKKLPELAKGMGQAMKEFKKASNEVEDNFRSAVQEEDRKKAMAAPAAAPVVPAAPAPTSASPSQPAQKL